MVFVTVNTRPSSKLTGNFRKPPEGSLAFLNFSGQQDLRVCRLMGVTLGSQEVT